MAADDVRLLATALRAHFDPRNRGVVGVASAGRIVHILIAVARVAPRMKKYLDIYNPDELAEACHELLDAIEQATK